MNNILILGSGRSGTSTMAGMLSNSGYYLGDNYIAPRKANPKGFFEDREVNSINNDLILNSTTGSIWHSLFDRFRVGRKQRPTWLYALEEPVTVGLASNAANRPYADRIRALISQKPFCYKDPRFSYTLPVWREFLPANTRFIIVFRHPITTAKSILREIAESPLRNTRVLRFTLDDAVDVWRCMYSCVLQSIDDSEGYLFVHFDQLLNGERIDEIQQFVEAPVDPTFVEHKIPRSDRQVDGCLSGDICELYQKLCEFAEMRTGVPVP